MIFLRVLAVVVAIGVLGCGDDGGSGDGDAGELINGCPPHRTPLAQPGEPIDGDTYASFAMPLFQSFCVRCHATTVTGDDRNGAPVDYDWDDETSVRAHLAEIRNAIGVLNFMPLTPPAPSCDQRRRMVRWIDAAAP